MAATEQDVKDLTGLDIDDDLITPFLAVAQCIIDQIAACLAAKGVDVDKLQAALASHYIALSPTGKGANVKVEEKFEGWSVKLSTAQSTGMGYDATAYGSMAKALAAGCLNDVDKRQPQIRFC